MRLKSFENGREATYGQIALVHSVLGKLQQYSLLVAFESHGFNQWLGIKVRRLERQPPSACRSQPRHLLGWLLGW
jgi:hypothetical protein